MKDTKTIENEIKNYTCGDCICFTGKGKGCGNKEANYKRLMVFDFSPCCCYFIKNKYKTTKLTE